MTTITTVRWGKPSKWARKRPWRTKRKNKPGTEKNTVWASMSSRGNTPKLTFRSIRMSSNTSIKPGWQPSSGKKSKGGSGPRKDCPVPLMSSTSTTRRYLSTSIPLPENQNLKKCVRKWEPTSWRNLATIAFSSRIGLTLRKWPRPRSWSSWRSWSPHSSKTARNAKPIWTRRNTSISYDIYQSNNKWKFIEMWFFLAGQELPRPSSSLRLPSNGFLASLKRSPSDQISSARLWHCRLNGGKVIASLA